MFALRAVRIGVVAAAAAVALVACANDDFVPGEALPSARHSAPPPPELAPADLQSCGVLLPAVEQWGRAYGEAVSRLLVSPSASPSPQRRAAGDAAVASLKSADAVLQARLKAEAPKVAGQDLKEAVLGLSAALEAFDRAVTPDSVARNPSVAAGLLARPDFVAAADTLDRVCGQVR